MLIVPVKRNPYRKSHIAWSAATVEKLLISLTEVDSEGAISASGWWPMAILKNC
jgi:hypothetical protein